MSTHEQCEHKVNTIFVHETGLNPYTNSLIIEYNNFIDIYEHMNKREYKGDDQERGLIQYFHLYLLTKLCSDSSCVNGLYNNLLLAINRRYGMNWSKFIHVQGAHCTGVVL